MIKSHPMKRSPDCCKDESDHESPMPSDVEVTVDANVHHFLSEESQEPDEQGRTEREE